MNKTRLINELMISANKIMPSPLQAVIQTDTKYYQFNAKLLNFVRIKANLIISCIHPPHGNKSLRSNNRYRSMTQEPNIQFWRMLDGNFLLFGHLLREKTPCFSTWATGKNFSSMESILRIPSLKFLKPDL